MSQREHGLQTYWFLKLIVLLTTPGEICPRKLSAYGLNKDRSGRDLELTKMLSTYANAENFEKNARRFYSRDHLAFVFRGGTFMRLLANRKRPETRSTIESK